MTSSEASPLAEYLAGCNRIADAWVIYDRKVLPSTAGAVQREETKRAFYAGCDWIFKRIVGAVDDEEAAVALLDGLHGELNGYFDDFRKKHNIPKEAG